ncbi:LOW QUALITY PROTEIN: hypothetical protein Cgig2_006751 [Carnegiea gigantea]|uniref:Uncharacterized protein n=1 Tax=Carnegiea gigantea TaxID=171969 RepID=A0A9Q1GWQ8_9CARY|nr:LOW QUALITY PROTEIN: hypothetical protein Cgig2_006751 [Carnegiea gigantea]
MFQSKITLEEYLKFVQHEDAASEDASSDDIDMIPDIEEEDVETVQENIFKSRVSINMNPSLITLADDFKDDKENLLQPIKKADSLFNRFLTDVAKRPSLCPLNYEDWGLVSHYFREVFAARWCISQSENSKVSWQKGFKYSFMSKYIKEDITTEVLHNLEKSKCLSAVGD